MEKRGVIFILSLCFASSLANVSYCQSLDSFNLGGEAYVKKADSYFAKLSSNPGNSQVDKELLTDVILDDYSRAIDMEPNNADYYAKRGFFYATVMGNFELALLDLNKALKLNPYSVEAYRARSKVYFCLKDFDKAWTDVHVLGSLGVKIDEDFLNKLKFASRRRN